jgi:hypothetical protein
MAESPVSDDGYLTKRELRRRGWNPDLINDLLGEPDIASFFDADHNTRTPHLFLRSRVEAMERDEQFVARPLRRAENAAALVAARMEQDARIDHRKQLIGNLRDARESFAGIGTRRAKLRLNKLVDSNPVAKAVRLALEIEDRNISAKRYWGDYSRQSYDDKSGLIGQLIEVFQEQGWLWGVQKSDPLPLTPSHVIYFDIPGCEQISWHHAAKGDAPEYPGVWDSKPGSTLSKLEALAITLLAPPTTAADTGSG